MIELSVDKIFWLSYFFLPGFIFLKAYKITIADGNLDFSKQVYEVFGYSLLNMIICSPLIFWMINCNFLINYLISFIALNIYIIIFNPILLVFIYKKVSSSELFARYLITPNPQTWDQFFSQRKSYWVVVVLKNKTKIGGFYGTKSMVSNSPAQEDLYLEEVWKVDDNNKFIEKVEQTYGVLITKNEISFINFY